jgi:hypothetical protein
MNRYETEIPKYLKQKESNVSKSKKKSKHKHQYEECLIQYNLIFLYCLRRCWSIAANAAHALASVLANVCKYIYIFSIPLFNLIS